MKKKLFIIMFILIIVMLGIKFIPNMINKNEEKEKVKKDNNIKKTEETLNFKSTGSNNAFEWGYLLQPPVIVEITPKYNDDCKGEDREKKKCDGDTKFDIKALSEGETLLWIYSVPDASKTNKDNTHTYNIKVDKNLNTTVKEVEYIPIN